jgi:hypothetical protein
VEGRDSIWGHQIGVRYGEGLISPNPIATEILIR